MTTPTPTVSTPPSVQAHDDQEYYELRAYRLNADGDSTLLDSYLAHALLPALNRFGVAKVGAFKQTDASDGPFLWVLIPYTSLETMVSVTATVNTDPAVVDAGVYYLQTRKENPAFQRVDSWLHLAFKGQRKLAAPSGTYAGPSRIFELRTYESYSEAKALKKIDMFNDGEIDIMREVGLAPVFYGQALVGRDLPHLAYLLSGPDRETYTKNWKAFQGHPTWISMKADPQYADTVSKITSRFLIPTPYSQL